MSGDPEALYLQFGRLVAELPDLNAPGPVSAEANRWLGKAAALVEYTGDKADVLTFKVAAQNLDGALRAQNAQAIKSVIYSALGRAELAAPLSAQGSFIQAGAAFDVFVAFGKVMASATATITIVDPYADEKALTDFAVQAPEKVAIQLLADEHFRKPSLKPATERWIAQFGPQRPLEVRLAPKGVLHDRLLVVDQKDVWTFGQSLNAIATRAHTSIVRADPETAALKVAAYAELWSKSAAI